MLRLLRIHPGEGLRAGLMLLWSVAAVGGVVITGQLVSRSLFLGRLGSADIPWKFILPPLALMLTIAVFGRVSARLRRDRLVLLTCGLAATGFVGARVLLTTPLGDTFGALCSLYVYTDVVGALVVLQFWTFAGDIFDPREARRLFGVIAGGSTISNLVFGAGLGAGAEYVETPQLLWVVVASLGTCAICAALLGRRCAARLDEIRGPARPVASGGSPERLSMSAEPLVATLAGLVLAITLLSTVADYQLDLALREAFRNDSPAMLSFLGRFRFVAGLGACILQFVVAGRLVERFGVIVALVLLPVSVAAGGGAILLTGATLWAAAVPRASDVVLKYTVFDAAVNLLYLPLGDRLRARAKALVDGILKPPVAAAAGLAFLVVGPGTTPVDWVIPLWLLVAAALAFAWRARAQYVESLARSLQLRRLDWGSVRLDLSDAGSVRVVRDALGEGDAMRVTHALSWAEQMGTVDWLADVLPLCHDPRLEVRAAAVAFLGRRGGAEVEAPLADALLDSEPRVRCAAVEGLAAHGDLDRARAAVDDAHPSVRGAAVATLLRRGEEDAPRCWRALAADAAVEARVLAAQLLADIDPVPAEVLAALLADPAETVVAAALRSVARTGPLPSLDRLEQLLARPRLRPAVLDVARRWHREAPRDLVAHIEAGLARPGDGTAATSLAPLHDLVTTLSESPLSAGDLQRWLAHPDPALRRAALRACVALRDRHGVSPPAPILDRAIPVALQDLRAWLVRRRALDPIDPLLADAVDQRLRAARERLLLLLDLRIEEVAWQAVTTSLDGHRRQMASAIELLDQVLPRAWSAAVLAALDPSVTDTDTPADPELLTELESAADPWLRACVHRARQLRTIPATPGALAMPLSLIEKVFFLKGVFLFQPLPGEEIAGIAPIVEEVEFAAGQLLIRRGDEGDCLYILVDGEVVADVPGGGERRMKSGQVLGELAILAQRPRSADCRAVTPVVALRLDKDAFWELLDQRPELAVEVMRVLVDRYVPETRG